MNSMKTKHYDVVIVGSGAGGGTAAWALSKKGLKVLLLEAGPQYDWQKDYKLHTSQWESPFPKKNNEKKFYSFASQQKLDIKMKHLRSWNHISGLLNKNEHRVSFGYHHVKGIGGSSLHFTGEAHRLNPKSMKMKSQFGVGADWPISYEDLEPYYQMAEEKVGVAGPAIDPHSPRTLPYSQKPHQLSYASQILKCGFDKLGLDLVENSLAVLSKATNDRPSCNYCGGCLRGCPRSDKGSIDVTYLRSAVKSGNCDIRSGCFAKKIKSNSNDEIEGLYYQDELGLQFVKTPQLIISCGAIETPRLLLASADSRSPLGLCNESGQVGKNFMETLLWTSSGLHPKSIGSHRGLPVDSICWNYNAPDSIPGVIGGCRFGPSQAESD